MGTKNKISLWYSAPLLSLLFFHLVCESMVIPILEPTLANPLEGHDMVPGFSAGMHKILYGFALAVYPIVVFCCAPVIGALSDKLGRRPVLLVSVIAAASGSFGQGLGMEFLSLPLFLAGRTLVGASAGVDGVIQAALLDRCVGEKQKNFYLGATLLAMSIGFMFGPAFAALAIRQDAPTLTWSLPFLILGFIFAAMYPVIAKNLPAKAAATEAKALKIDWLSGIRDIAKLKESKEARGLILMFVLSQTASGCFTATIPLILTQTFGFSIKMLAAFISVGGVFAGIIFGFVGPQMLLRFKKTSALRFAMCMCVTAVIFPFVASSETIWVLTCIQASGFALSYYVMLSIFSESTDESMRGWILSVLSSMWGLTMGMGLLLCGLLAWISNWAALGACIVLAAASLYLSLAKIKNFKMHIS